MSLYEKSALAVCLGLLCACTSMAQEKRIKRSDLPAAVEKTVQAESEGATIRGFSQEKDGGKMYYEVELTVNGHNKDVSMDESGAVTEVEEEVPFAQLPPGVQKGLNTKADSGKIIKVESLTKHGKLVAYEAETVTAGKKSEVQVGSDGAPLKHEE